MKIDLANGYSANQQPSDFLVYSSVSSVFLRRAMDALHVMRKFPMRARLGPRCREHRVSTFL